MPKTKSDCTYFLAAFRGRSKRPHAVKIGRGHKDAIQTRVRNLQTGSTDRIEVLGVVRGSSAERKFHHRYSGFRIRGTKEWFKAAPEILNLIAALVQVQELVERMERNI